jgi:hypothetical protein
MYSVGQGVFQDDKEAAKWTRKAAEQGVPQAQYNLGWMYAMGSGVPQSDTEAVQWFQKAAAQGDVEAQRWLNALRMKKWGR